MMVGHLESAETFARHVRVGHPQAGENRYFQVLHDLRLIVGLVIIANEVEKAMHREVSKVMQERACVRLRLRGPVV